MKCIYLILLLYCELIIGQHIGNNNSNTNQYTSKNIDGFIIYGVIGGFICMILIGIIIIWIRLNNICYISSCINTICSKTIIDTFCSECDNCIYLNNNDSCVYCCCLCNPCTTCLSCEDNTLYSQYMKDIVYSRNNNNISFSDYKKLLNLKNDLIQYDHEFRIKNKKLCLELNNDISDDEDTPLISNRIVIND